ncbi:MAG: hypothetical protein AMS15_04540 [Planctomycetes bacterium DG_23]|nr:MAG: hypothetical protein AMS15_04540 [Planctomycetes bacterium DG_23]
MKASVIIPAYNEEEGIQSVVRGTQKALEAWGDAFEIIVVDDGSTDETAEKARKLGVRLVGHEENLGYGRAIKSGISQANSENIVIIDADGTYSPSDIPRLLNFMAEYDMIVGARLGKFVKVSIFRRPAKWLFSKLANYIAGRKIPDLNSGLRVFKKSTAMEFLHILPDGFSFTATLTLAVLASGGRVKYEPINYQSRVGKSKIRPLRDTLNFFSLLVRTAMYFNPLKVFLPVGLALLLVGTCLAIYQVARPPRNVTDVALLIFFTGLHFLALGLLADLILRRGAK